jgi:hypothetical protein
MSYYELDEAAVRQAKLSAGVHHAHISCRSEAHRYRHELRWDDSSGQSRLLKVDPVTKATLHDFGVHSAASLAFYETHEGKRAAAVEALEQAERKSRKTASLNQEHGINRVPDVVIKLLNTLAAHKLSEHYIVIGTHALFAYEMAAGVTFESQTMETRDVDLLWNVQQRIKLLHTQDKSDRSMLSLLQEVDPTFIRNEEDKQSAVNSTSFSVDFLRRKERVPLSDAVCITRVEGDMYPVQAPRSQRFLNAPRFEQVIIGHSGAMAIMRTVDPDAFVEFKTWMSIQDDDDRAEIKKRRDSLQAVAVQKLINEGRLKGTRR